jgi:thiamine pyrophosphokinase
VAADGGVRVAEHYHLRVNTVLGDMDSLTEAQHQTLTEQQATILRYPAEKDETDLELALVWAAKQGADWIRLLGATGGRLDQILSNIYLLTLPILDGRDVQLVAGKQAAWLAKPGRTDINGAVGDTISLIPLTGTVRGVRTENLYYPLNDEDLYFGPARGVSNVIAGSSATAAPPAAVSVREGVLLVIHTIGRA